MVANKATDAKHTANAKVIAVSTTKDAESSRYVDFEFPDKAKSSIEDNSVPGTLRLPAGELFLHPPIKPYNSCR